MEIADLHTRFLESNSICIDTRKIQKKALFFALKGPRFDGNQYAEKALNHGAHYAIIDNPKYAYLPRTILVDDVLKTLQILAKYHRTYLGIPIIALTGSNGKTTTKALFNAVLSQHYRTTATQGNLNNHIGVPLTLLSMDRHTEMGVVEMGANHQGEIASLCEIVQPDYGYITNFGEAHLEGFGGLKGVIAGKSELYDYLIAHQKKIFVNTQDPIQFEKTKMAQCIPFGNTDTTSVKFIDANPFVKLRYKDLLIQSQLIGTYNATNIAAAIAVGAYFKVPDMAIDKAIAAYVPSDNRSEIIDSGGVKIILDAYNANPSSMRAALLNLSQQQLKPTMAILGDMLELGEFTAKAHQDIVDLCVTLGIDRVCLIGTHFGNTRASFNHIKQYSDIETFQAASDLPDSGTVLIKGSRGMTLERVMSFF